MIEVFPSFAALLISCIEAFPPASSASPPPVSISVSVLSLIPLCIHHALPSRPPIDRLSSSTTLPPTEPFPFNSHSPPGVSRSVSKHPFYRSESQYVSLSTITFSYCLRASLHPLLIHLNSVSDQPHQARQSKGVRPQGSPCLRPFACSLACLPAYLLHLHWQPSVPASPTSLYHSPSSKLPKRLVCCIQTTLAYSPPNPIQFTLCSATPA